jgi:hypothetical protein
MPYKNLEQRKLKNKEHVASYRLRLKEKTLLELKINRFCKLCKTNINHKRKDAIFCSREHKRIFSDSKRDFKAEYNKNILRKRKLNLIYYYADHEKSKNKLLLAQKKRLPLIAAYEAKRRSTKLQRTPKWLTNNDIKVIKGFYSIAAMLTRENKEPWHVDHIIPLQGELVSGLHVLNNLQLMRGIDNISKNNKYEVA